MSVHLLFDQDGPRIGLEDRYESGPVLDKLEPLAARLRTAQQRLRSTTFDDLLGLCDAAARSWTQPEHALADLIRQYHLGFLPLWMRRTNLQSLARRSLRGRPEALDRFVPFGESDPLMVRAQPRGLVVHWVAGNVPVLGLLSLVQAMLCKNANIVKVSRRRPGMLPQLLAALSATTFTNAGGENLNGRTLTDSTAVIYADHQDLATANELSCLADVRVAWGGREAVDAIVNLPRNHGTEDIVFGPKTSFAVIGAERLADRDAARRTAAAIAADALAFDQQGCNSPHTVFVERGGSITPAEFARVLADAMEILCRRAPLTEVDPADVMNVLAVRTEYAMRAEAYHGNDMQWTVVFSDEDKGLAEPCYLRTLFVRPVDDIFEVAAFCSLQTQTAGLAVDERRHALADALTARGVDRCPAVGAMRIYDAPWDGLFAMDRLVRWVSSC
jgi:hypothetical protein